MSSSNLLEDISDASLQTLSTLARPLNLMRTAEDGETNASLMQAKSEVVSERKEALADLRASMRANELAYRQKLVDLSALNDTLIQRQSSLGDAVSASEADATEYAKFHREMSGDLALQGRHEDWSNALSTFMDGAFGKMKGLEPIHGGRVFKVPSILALSKFLCRKLDDAEPQVSNATGLVLWREAGSALKCYHAEGPCGLEPGQTIRGKYKSQEDQDVWNVCMSGEPLLRNPHGLEEVARTARSIVPLKAADGRAMGAIVSGPPALPDECVELFARMSGQIFERAWRLELVSNLVGLVKKFIESACSTDNKLCYVKFETDVSNLGWNPVLSKVVVDPEEWWNWQPLMFSRPAGEKTFHLPLKWSNGGEWIGALVVECATFTAFDEKLLILLHTVAPMMIESIKKIEKVMIGEWGPLSTIGQIMASFEIYKCDVPLHLYDEMKHQLAHVDFGRVIAELKHYIMRVEDKDLFRLLKAFLILLGFKPKKIKQWKDIRNVLKASGDIPRMMIALIESSWQGYSGGELPFAGDRRGIAHSKAQQKKVSEARKAMANIRDMYDESDAILQKVDLDELNSKSPGAVQLLIRWMKISRMVHNVTMAISADVAARREDPIADEIFDIVDVDDDGLVTSAELVTYLVDQYGTAAAHKLLRAIDYNGDGTISRREWHRGFELGAFQTEAGSPRKDDAEAGGPSKRSSGPRLSLNVVGGGKQVNTNKVHPGLPSPAKGSNSKKLAPIATPPVTSSTR